MPRAGCPYGANDRNLPESGSWLAADSRQHPCDFSASANVSSAPNDEVVRRQITLNAHR